MGGRPRHYRAVDPGSAVPAAFLSSAIQLSSFHLRPKTLLRSGVVAQLGGRTHHPGRGGLTFRLGSGGFGAGGLVRPTTTTSSEREGVPEGRAASRRPPAAARKGGFRHALPKPKPPLPRKPATTSLPSHAATGDAATGDAATGDAAATESAETIAPESKAATAMTAEEEGPPHLLRHGPLCPAPTSPESWDPEWFKGGLPLLPRHQDPTASPVSAPPCGGTVFSHEQAFKPASWRGAPHPPAGASAAAIHAPSSTAAPLPSADAATAAAAAAEALPDGVIDFLMDLPLQEEPPTGSATAVRSAVTPKDTTPRPLPSPTPLPSPQQEKDAAPCSRPKSIATAYDAHTATVQIASSTPQYPPTTSLASWPRHPPMPAVVSPVDTTTRRYLVHPPHRLPQREQDKTKAATASLPSVPQAVAYPAKAGPADVLKAAEVALHEAWLDEVNARIAGRGPSSEESAAAAVVTPPEVTPRPDVSAPPGGGAVFSPERALKPAASWRGTPHPPAAATTAAAAAAALPEGVADFLMDLPLQETPPAGSASPVGSAAASQAAMADAVPKDATPRLRLSPAPLPPPRQEKDAAPSSPPKSAAAAYAPPTATLAGANCNVRAASSVPPYHPTPSVATWPQFPPAPSLAGRPQHAPAPALVSPVDAAARRRPAHPPRPLPRRANEGLERDETEVGETFPPTVPPAAEGRSAAAPPLPRRPMAEEALHGASTALREAWLDEVKARRAGPGLSSEGSAATADVAAPPEVTPRTDDEAPYQAYRDEVRARIAGRGPSSEEGAAAAVVPRPEVAPRAPADETTRRADVDGTREAAPPAPSDRKTELCRNFERPEERGPCARGDRCAFAHGKGDLQRRRRTPPLPGEAADIDRALSGWSRCPSSSQRLRPPPGRCQRNSRRPDPTGRPGRRRRLPSRSGRLPSPRAAPPPPAVARSASSPRPPPTMELAAAAAAATFPSARELVDGVF